ncbi:MAG: PQQ-dependent sugar dehydrogenase [Pseudomonadota bacterium]
MKRPRKNKTVSRPDAPNASTIVAGAAFLAAAGTFLSAAAQLPPNARGGGDSGLQKTLADPAPEGALPLNVEVLAENLAGPWSIAFLPTGDILVTEKMGRLRVIRDGALVQSPVEGVPEVLTWNQGGLFDVLPHPNFDENRTIFLVYAHGDKKANGTRVARATFNGFQLSDLTPIFDAIPTKDTGHHYGGRLVWGPDDKLYLTVGEGSKYKEKAQDYATSYGAVIRINEDGSIPDDNPDFGSDAAPGLWTKGHRNPQGLAYDAERGVLWENEHGARGGDEINIVKKGENYGWPLATYGIDYNGARITPFTEYDGTTQPVKYWTPSIAPSGLAVYRGDLFPEDWDGDLLVGALAGAALHRVDMDGMDVVGEETFLTGDDRVRDVRVGPEGAIYVATEIRGGAPGGKILRLTPKS